MSIESQSQHSKSEEAKLSSKKPVALGILLKTIMLQYSRLHIYSLVTLYKCLVLILLPCFTPLRVYDKEFLPDSPTPQSSSSPLEHY